MPPNSWVQLPLSRLTVSPRTFRQPKPFWQEGKKYTHKIRWFLAEMSIPGLFREEVARGIGQALLNDDGYKYTRTKLRSQGQLILHVLPEALGSVIPGGPDKMAAVISPCHFAKLHEKVREALEHAESP